MNRKSVSRLLGYVLMVLVALVAIWTINYFGSTLGLDLKGRVAAMVIFAFMVFYGTFTEERADANWRERLTEARRYNRIDR